MNGKTYRIKPLDWERGERNPVIYARTLFGSCQIWPKTGEDGCRLFMFGSSTSSDFSTIQEAKAVAEKTVASKLLEALEEV
jgi:hypothetical protein